MTFEAVPPPPLTPPAGSGPGAPFEARYRAAQAAAEARDEQLALLAHDLRNPLNALAVSAEVLKRVAGGAPEVQAAVAVIVRQVSKLATLIDARLPPAGRPAGPAEAPPPTVAGLRVAVIDQDADAASGVQRLLEAAGHQVSAAAGAEVGLALLLQAPPDVALVAIDLPEAGGCSFARRARHAGYGGRLVALAGHRLAADPAASLAAGFEAHLLKPVPPGLLARLLSPP